MKYPIPFLVVLVLLSPLSAQQAGRHHDLTPEDYFTLATITEVAPSPDGRFVAYAELRWDQAADRRSTDLWVVSCKTGETRRLTFDPASDSSPTWSPDSRIIYFASSRKRAGEKTPPHDGKRQVWRISPEGGDAVAVTRVPGGIGLFDLGASGRTLYYTRSSKSVGGKWKALKKRFSALEYGHGVTAFGTVWKLDLASWRNRKIVDEKRVIRFLAVSPDEKRIAMITTPEATAVTYEGWSEMDVFDVTTGKVTRLVDDLWREKGPSPFGWLKAPAWSADSRALAFDVSYDGYPTEILVAEWADPGIRIRRLDRPREAHVAPGHVVWRGKGRDLCFAAESRARVRVWCVTEVNGEGQGNARPLTPGPGGVAAFGFAAASGDLAVVRETTTEVGDVFLVGEGGEYRRLTRVNPQVDTWKLPDISTVRWKGAGGVEVEGILELPPDHRPGKPLPMIVELHGGPTASTKKRLRFWIYGRALMPAKGYALFSPNYRGSTGYGDRFMTDLIGRENDIEVEDILLGVDAMVARGIADPDRLGVMGWSNGGLLTNCLIGKTTRFKAASSGAGVLDMVMQWGQEDTPGHVINFMKGTLPWQNPELYRRSSPLYHLGNVKTPTLIHVGGKDPRCPAGHSRSLFRALHRYLKVPTELVVYPGAVHGLSTYQHRLAKMKWDLAWFERYLPVK